jgi:hypothetical protein
VTSQVSNSIADRVAAAFAAPSLDYAALLPLLIVFGAALVAVLVEAFAPRRQRFTAQVGVALVGLVGPGCRPRGSAQVAPYPARS